MAKPKPEDNGETVLVTTDDAVILECLLGMSSARWGNGPDAEGKSFKLAHFSPRHLGDKSTQVFADCAQVRKVIRENIDKVWPFYRQFAEVN